MLRNLRRSRWAARLTDSKPERRIPAMHTAAVASAALPVMADVA